LVFSDSSLGYINIIKNNWGKIQSVISPIFINYYNLNRLFTEIIYILTLTDSRGNKIFQVVSDILHFSLFWLAIVWS
jgi:hypothetical protein